MTASCESPQQAWVAIESPLERGQTLELLRDPERLLRLNSLVAVQSWTREKGVDLYRLRAAALCGGYAVDTPIQVTHGEYFTLITYLVGLKRSTRFRVCPIGSGCRLEIVEDYGGCSRQELDARIDEVDNSLVQWARDIGRYMRAWRRWSWCAPARWYLWRVWPRMSPLSRRVCLWLVYISIAEFVAFLLVFCLFLLGRDPH